MGSSGGGGADRVVAVADGDVLELGDLGRDAGHNALHRFGRVRKERGRAALRSLGTDEPLVVRVGRGGVEGGWALGGVGNRIEDVGEIRPSRPIPRRCCL